MSKNAINNTCHPDQLCLETVREILIETLDALRNGVCKQDLKLGLAFILSNDLKQGFSPDVLREVGVKDVPKGVAEPIRHILIRRCPSVELKCKSSTASNGRKASRYYFSRKESVNTNQISLML